MVTELEIKGKTFSLEEEIKYLVDGCRYFIRHISTGKRFVTIENRGGVSIEVKSIHIAKLKK